MSDENVVRDGAGRAVRVIGAPRRPERELADLFDNLRTQELELAETFRAAVARSPELDLERPVRRMLRARSESAKAAANAYATAQDAILRLCADVETGALVEVRARDAEEALDSLFDASVRLVEALEAEDGETPQPAVALARSELMRVLRSIPRRHR